LFVGRGQKSSKIALSALRAEQFLLPGNCHINTLMLVAPLRHRSFFFNHLTPPSTQFALVLERRKRDKSKWALKAQISLNHDEEDWGMDSEETLYQ
jgi:hypothetical protein